MTAMTAVTSPEPEDEPVDEAAEILQTPVGQVEVAGVECRINRMKTREMFALLRIVTLGGTNVDMVASVFEKGQSEEVMAQKLFAAILVTIPSAENDVVDLIRKMVGKTDAATPDEWVKVQRELANPDLDVTLAVVQAIVEQEAGEIVRLGKVARSWWETMGPSIKAKVAPKKDSG